MRRKETDMTTTEFDKLPMLLRSRDAREAFNCDRETLRELRDAYPDLAVRFKGMKQWRYRKAVIAEIIGQLTLQAHNN
jgi:hypothetical protein